MARYQRTYGGLGEMGSDGAAQSKLSIANTFEQFQGLTTSLGTTFGARNAKAKATAAATEYDPSKGAPKLSKNGNAAGQSYNAVVIKSYQQKVQNDAHARLAELSEIYKDDPQSYNAAVAENRTSLINEAGPEMAGLAGLAFDTQASQYDAQIRIEIAKQNRAQARVEQGIRITQSESLARDYVAGGGDDPEVIAGLLEGYDDALLSSESFNDQETQAKAIEFRKDLTLNLYLTDLRTNYLENGDVAGAMKKMQAVRNRQVTDGSASDLTRQTGQTPEQIAEVMSIAIKQHVEESSVAVKAESSQRTATSQELALAATAANKNLIDLGPAVTADDVNLYRASLSSSDYRNWIDRVNGKPAEKNTLGYSAIYSDVLVAVQEENFTSLKQIEDDAVGLFRDGKISLTEYNSIRDAALTSRFGPGQELLGSMAKTATQLGKMTSTIGVQRAHSEFESWMRANPEATPEQSEERVIMLIKKHIPDLAGTIIGFDSAGGADEAEKKAKVDAAYAEAVARLKTNDPALIRVDQTYIKTMQAINNGG